MMNPVWQSEHGELLGEIIDELTGVVGFAELLQKDAEKRDQYAAEVLQSAERGLELVRSLSAKLLQPSPRRRCRINEVVLDLEPSLRRVVGRNLPLEVGISPNFDSVPLGRRDLEALLLYLVAAARDAYASPGPIRVRTSRIKNADGSRWARITVEDEAGAPRAGDMRWFLLGEGPTDLLNGLTPFVERAREAGGVVRLECSPQEARTTVSIEFLTDGPLPPGREESAGASLPSVTRRR